MIRLLFLGDLVGEAGRNAAKFVVERLLNEQAVDFVVVNGENSANGRGISAKIDLLRSGVAVITTGDHVWDQKDTATYIPTEPRLLRPINYPPGAPGAGSIVLDTPKGKVAVMNVQCRTFMNQQLDNPFVAAEEEAHWLRNQTPVIFVDVHGETTSEKTAMARHLDGVVSAVVGTHTHVQTADERILPRGTAFLCDAGMCGAIDSIIGREAGPVIQKFRDGLPARFHVAKGPSQVCGALIEIDPATGKASTIQRIREVVEMTH